MASQDTDPKVEEIHEHDDTHTHGHDHENCGHDHSHPHHDGEEAMPGLESQPKLDKKLKKAEKKCIKALNKLGLKPQSGITRVTLKRRDGLVFVISAPEVYKSPTSENSFVVVGELKMDEPRINDIRNKVPRPTGETATAAPTTDAPTEVKTESKEEEKVPAAKVEETTDEGDNEPLSEEGLTPMHIDMVMQNASCTRNQAIKALRETNNDMVNAIMLIQK